MKKLLVFLFVFMFSKIFYAQFEPRICIKDTKEELLLSYLDIDIKINGNYALSTYTMKFYNGYDRVLEGELNFPLLEGQSVVSFSMEVNGNLREAVVVEKEIARVAYETTVRRKIDPGLLEKTQGNNYKVRVYPINSKSEKLIKITIEEKLKLVGDKNELSLVFDGEKSLKDFSLSVDVTGGELLLDKESEKLNFEKTRFKNHQIIKLKKKNESLSKINYKFYNKIIVFPIIDVSDHYFNVTTEVEVERKRAKSPKKITVLWDTSLSMLERDLEKELQFLDAYFRLFPNLKVDLITFSNKVQSKKGFEIKNSQWFDLRKELSGLTYDGATNYNVLAQEKLNENILIFTDGLGSFDDFEALKGTVLLINSLKKSDHSSIHYLGGDREDLSINLVNNSVEKSISEIKNKSLLFMGYKPNKEIYEVYVKDKIRQDLFSFSGKIKEDTTIVLLFGDGDKVLATQKIDLKLNGNNELSERLWAKKKLSVLEKNKKRNKSKIINHAKEYSLITDYTSLIVLDRLEDYLKYKIEPPKELQRDYKRKLERQKNKDERAENRLVKRRNSIKKEAQEIYTWYDKIIKNKPVKKYVVREVSTSQNIIAGVVVDENNEVLLGVNISKIGTSVAAISNFDGEFRIKADIRNKLRFSSLGYVTKEVKIYNNSPLRIRLEKDSSVLEEVVVIGYGRQKKKEVTGSVENIVYSEEAEDVAYEDVSIALQGSVAGVRVRESVKNKQKLRTKNPVLLKSWNPKTPYLKELKTTESSEKAYTLYLSLRNEYMSTPTFFIDVSDYFIKQNKVDLGIQILSNLLELELNNYELLKAMSYKLEELNMFDLAVKVNQKIVELRPEDPQSYRDLAIAYEVTGEVQKAFDLLYRVYSGEFLKYDEGHRFEGIEQISFVELSRLISKYKKELKLTKEQQKEFEKLLIDIRVVVDWNHNDTDLDLWVIDPYGEKCYYSHKSTKQGGRISNDMTEGFGPEEFMLKKAIKGNYTIKVKYYSDTKQKISGQTIVKLTLFTNYGTSKETKTITTRRLASKSEVIEIGNIKF